MAINKQVVYHNDSEVHAIDNRSYVPAIDETVFDGNGLTASASGFGVAHPVSTRAPDGTVTETYSYEVLDAYPGWYMRGETRNGIASDIDSDFEMGTLIGTTDSEGIDVHDSGAYLLTFAAAIPAGLTVGADVWHTVVTTTGRVAEGKVVSIVSGTDILVEPISDALSWEAIERSIGTNTWHYTNTDVVRGATINSRQVGALEIADIDSDFNV